MATEAVSLHTRDGRVVEASAVVQRPSSGGRLAKVVGMAVGGLVLGAASIVVPVAHFVLPWALPIAGVLGAWMAWNTRAVIGEVRGVCPECSTAMVVPPYGAFEEPCWLRCPQCSTPFALRLRESRDKL